MNFDKFMWGFFFLLFTGGYIWKEIDTRYYLPERQFHNLDVKIVAIGHEETYTKDKFHTPTESNLVLLQSIQDTTLFMEHKVTNERYYSLKIGDTLHWDFIQKYKFFTIKRR